MKRTRHTVLYLPGIRSLAEFEFEDDKAVKKALRAEAHKLRSRMQQAFSPKRLRSVAKDRLWLRRFAELEEWQRRCEKEEQATERYLQSLRASMQNEMERTWLEQQLARVKKVGREIARDMARAERKELLRRGVVRGRRK